MEKQAAGELINLRMQGPPRYRKTCALALNASALELRPQQLVMEAPTLKTLENRQPMHLTFRNDTPCVICFDSTRCVINTSEKCGALR